MKIVPVKALQLLQPSTRDVTKTCVRQGLYEELLLLLLYRLRATRSPLLPSLTFFPTCFHGTFAFLPYPFPQRHIFPRTLSNFSRGLGNAVSCPSYSSGGVPPPNGLWCFLSWIDTICTSLGGTGYAGSSIVAGAHQWWSVTVWPTWGLLQSSTPDVTKTCVYQGLCRLGVKTS